MLWNTFLAISIILPLFVIAGSRLRNRKVPMVGVLLVAVMLSTLSLLLPVYVNSYQGEAMWPVKALSIAIQNTMQVFSLDGDYDSFRSALPDMGPFVRNGYLIWGAFLHALAPVLTVSAILSIFIYLTGYIRLYLGLYSELYVFSDLNEKSLCLAEDCMKHAPKGRFLHRPTVVFADVFDEGDESSFERIHTAGGVPAICMKKDVLELPISWRNGRNVQFFVIGSDENENIQHMLGLVEQYGERDNGSLYFFNSSAAGAAMMASVMSDSVRMRIRRIDEPQALVYSYLYEQNIFENPVPAGDGTFALPIVIVGAGQMGMEFLKAVIWSGQMPGYRLMVHVFDQDEDAEDRFCAMCPELMEKNNCWAEGDAQYLIRFHRKEDGRGFDVRTRSFMDEMAGLGCVSRVFVTLGSDELNIETAMKLRALFLRNTPQQQVKITAVVSDVRKSRVLHEYELQNYKKQTYDIEFIGDIRNNYSCDVIMKSELEQAGRSAHERWCTRGSEEEIRLQKREFDKYDYFYRSSLAKVIRTRIRSRMCVSGSEKPLNERTDEEKRRIQLVEHMGWNAYMRTEGYHYSAERNDLAMQHDDLVAFSQLDEAEQLKDDD